MLDESSPEEIKYPHFAHDKSASLSANLMQTFILNLSQHRCLTNKKVLIYSQMIDNINITDEVLQHKSFFRVLS